ncbi:DUF4190 domain-containing protein [Agromyces sp. NPDC004153]|nr:DUF4190 domain-containing protein [Agromyces mariniharenae]
MTDPNLPEQQPGGAVPPPPPPPPPAPDYGTPQPQQPAPAYGQQAPAYGQPAPAYGQPAPGYGQPYGQPAKKTNVLAIVSLIASIAGFVIAWGIGSIVGIICGHISLSQIKKTGEEGRGLAVAGLIVGYIGLALAILSVIVLAIVFGSIAASGGFTTQY